MELLFFFFLTVKHYVADLYLQSKMPKGSKDDLSNPKGYIHAGEHALLTFIVVLFFTAHMGVAFGFLVIDFLLHFLIDYSKSMIGKRLSIEWNSKNFWTLTTVDQIVHSLCYLLYTYILFL